MSLEYFEALRHVLDEVERTQEPAIRQGAQILAKTIASGRMVYVFGASHASIPAQEMFYRAGGLVPINPILPPGLTTDVRPITRTTHIERMPGYASVILRDVPLQAGDVLIVVSVSGRNTVPVEMAEEAKRRGAVVIAVTSLAYSKTVSSRAPSGRLLYETADLVLDLCGEPGDAAVQVPGLPQRVGPTSTAAAVAILNAMVVETVRRLQEMGVEPPVFLSANLDGADAHNAELIRRYQDRLTYM
ncbi:MAG: sugar isomerase domain-containing protein [Armatimonadota bacterium]